MFRPGNIFAEYSAAVDALRSHFSADGEKLIKGESLSQFDYSSSPLSLDWVRKNLPVLADALLPARFQVRLNIGIHDIQAVLLVQRENNRLEGDCESVGARRDASPSSLPDKAVSPFNRLRQVLNQGATGLLLDDIYTLLETLDAADVSPELSVSVFLDKQRIGQRMLRSIAKNDRPRMVPFLFTKALSNVLEPLTLERFEKEFAGPGRRTVIPVFDFTGWLAGDVLAIIGRDQPQKLAAYTDAPLPADTLQQIEKTLAFRKRQSSWEFPTTWLTPQTFDLSGEFPPENSAAGNLLRQLESFRSLLSAIFLADAVEFSEDRFWVEYRGLGRTRFAVERRNLLDSEGQWDNLYQLYLYAYERFSTDKLEIAQQFLSLIAQDLPSLGQRAGEIRDATRKTYDRALAEKVQDYFEARHKIQERLKSAVAETSQEVTALTREVSGDLYKIAGVIITAAIGGLLKPEFSLWAALVGSLLIVFYLALVLLYYLSGLKAGYDLQMRQHADYIETFKDVLSEREVADFLADAVLREAQSLFSTRYYWAIGIYLFFLLAALAMAVIAGYGLLSIEILQI